MRGRAPQRRPPPAAPCPAGAAVRVPASVVAALHLPVPPAGQEAGQRQRLFRRRQEARVSGACGACGSRGVRAAPPRCQPPSLQPSRLGSVLQQLNYLPRCNVARSVQARRHSVGEVTVPPTAPRRAPRQSGCSRWLAGAASGRMWPGRPPPLPAGLPPPSRPRIRIAGGARRPGAAAAARLPVGGRRMGSRVGRCLLPLNVDSPAASRSTAHLARPRAAGPP